MKNIFNKVKLLTGLLVLVFLLLPSLSIGQSKELEKARTRQYKIKLKEYKKEGWKIDASSKSLEVALLEHYEKLKSPDYREISGLVSNCISKNVCRQAAYNNAIISYASLAGSYLKGKINSDIQIDQSSVGAGEFDKMYAAYERLVSNEMKGEIEESLSLVRQKGELKEYQIIFLINEKNASSKRQKALENAFKETNIAQQYASKISDFVKSGFESGN